MKAPVKLCRKDLIIPHPEVAKQASKGYTNGENAVSFCSIQCGGGISHCGDIQNSPGCAGCHMR